MASGYPSTGHGLNPVDALRSARDALLERGDQASVMVAGAIATMLNNGLTFEAGMGLAPGWRVAAQHRARDHALAEIAARFFPSLSGRELARAVAMAFRRYSVRWARDRAANRRGDGLDGLLFDVLIVGPSPGFSQLRNIFKSLAGQSVIGASSGGALKLGLGATRASTIRWWRASTCRSVRSETRRA